MQRDKTIQFWDDYHDENDADEWISKPGEELLEMIIDQIQIGDKDDEKFISQRGCVSVLEIGCGTSTLVRDLKEYIEKKNPMVDVIACGTDVSKVCIDANTKRDCTKEHGDEIRSDSRGSLWYEVLNVLNDSNPSRQNWDLIIDKGCLDTFLFRSRQRGIQNKNYPKALRILLDNIHRWQGNTSITEPTNIDHQKIREDVDEKRTNPQVPLRRERPGVYICITPRPKLKAVRDYAGFSSVRRYKLPKYYGATLESKGNNGNKEERFETGRVEKSNDGGSPGFVFVCTRNDEYEVGVSIPFPSASSSSSGQGNQNPPNDTSKCSRCEQTYLEFRTKGGLECRGEAYCSRKWKSHIVHCKSGPIKTNS